MAQEVTIRGATFSGVPSISVPDSNGEYHSFVDESEHIIGNLIHLGVCDKALEVAYTLRQQTYTERTNHNGYMFRANSSNNGSKVCYYPVDIRGYTKLSVSGGHWSNQTNSTRSYCDIAVGTLAELEAIRYENHVTNYDCLEVFHGQAGNARSDDINVLNFNISSKTRSATEPIYIGLRLNSYYGSYNHIIINELRLD